VPSKAVRRRLFGRHRLAATATIKQLRPGASIATIRVHFTLRR
jgi:hypothetical protein